MSYHNNIIDVKGILKMADVKLTGVNMICGRNQRWQKFRVIQKFLKMTDIKMINDKNDINKKLQKSN